MPALGRERLSACVRDAQTNFSNGTLEDGDLTAQDWENARDDVAQAAGWRASCNKAGCEELTRSALHLLAPLHVLILEDSPWATLHAVARGAPSFLPPKADTWTSLHAKVRGSLLPFQPLPGAQFNHSWMPKRHAAANLPENLLQYHTKASTAAARAENVCSIALLKRFLTHNLTSAEVLRSNHTHE